MRRILQMHLDASGLIETLVAMTIITVFGGLAYSFLTRLKLQPGSDLQMHALELLDDSMAFERALEGIDSILTIKIEYYESSDASSSARIDICDRNNKEIISLHLCYVPGNPSGSEGLYPCGIDPGIVAVIHRCSGRHAPFGSD